KLLDDKRRPLIVSIYGRVGSNTPIDCPDSGSRAVILVEKAEKHFLVKCNIKKKKKNDAKNEKRNIEKEWVRKSELMSSRRREVPWYLVRNGTLSCYCISSIVKELSEESKSDLECLKCGVVLDSMVHVEGCDGTSSLLTVASDLFLDSGVRSHNHRDLEMLGVKRIEWVLPIGDYLTVIGCPNLAQSLPQLLV
ncbi:hypothetical protein Tsubulata_051519, partial [Turnera subulata]